ncbi:MAG: hypothetical protein PARBB_03530 [Parabacteroides distasonis]
MNLLMILIARIEFCEKNVLYTGHRMRIYYSIFCLLVYYSFLYFFLRKLQFLLGETGVSFRLGLCKR